MAVNKDEDKAYSTLSTSRGGEGAINQSQNDDEEVIFIRLKRLHLAAAVFMGIQTIAYGVAGADATCSPSVGFPTRCDGPICSPDMKVLGDTNPIWLITFFVALASFDHICAFFVAHLWPDVAKFWIFRVEANPLRWAEYSVSASIMAVALSILCGVHDVHLWFCVLLLSAVGLSLGLVVELLPDDGPTSLCRGHVSFNALGGNSGTASVQPSSSALLQQTPHWAPRFSTLRSIVFAISSVSIFSPWMVMFCYFFKIASEGDIPDFVYAAFLGTFLLFLTFGVNSYLCHIGKRYPFHRAEMIYVLLSFTAKTFLAADVFGGLAASSGNDDGA